MALSLIFLLVWITAVWENLTEAIKPPKGSMLILVCQWTFSLFAEGSKSGSIQRCWGRKTEEGWKEDERDWRGGHSCVSVFIPMALKVERHLYEDTRCPLCLTARAQISLLWFCSSLRCSPQQHWCFQETLQHLQVITNTLSVLFIQLHWFKATCEKNISITETTKMVFKHTFLSVYKCETHEVKKNMYIDIQKKLKIYDNGRKVREYGGDLKHLRWEEISHVKSSDAVDVFLLMVEWVVLPVFR